MSDSQLPDWSRFEVKQPLNFPVDTIHNMWLNQANLEKWFLRLAEFRDKTGRTRERKETIEPGDTYRWRWFGWPDSVEETGEILEARNNEFIRFVFGKAGIVSVRTEEIKGQTVMMLLQEEIPLDEESKINFHVGCKTGWTFYMLNMKSILSGGPDLRNKQNDLWLD